MRENKYSTEVFGSPGFGNNGFSEIQRFSEVTDSEITDFRE